MKHELLAQTNQICQNEHYQTFGFTKKNVFDSELCKYVLFYAKSLIWEENFHHNFKAFFHTIMPIAFTFDQVFREIVAHLS